MAEAAGARVLQRIVQRRDGVDPATLVGSGKAREIAEVAKELDAELILVLNDLRPRQRKNLEKIVPLPIVDRTMLILDVFARHARSREGKLQVELAQLRYRQSNLIGVGADLSRLGGGIGTRGPGETKLETDRRRIHTRVRNVRQALERVREQRGQQRLKRERVPLATIALVGYTNAGKSTLFNQLTGAGVLTSGRMFATLDPTIRSLCLPSRRQVLLSDTVGFLRHLPHGLINAFRATLEEVTRASLLVVVADAHAPHRDEHERQVQQVLGELGVAATPQVRVWNKADLVATPLPAPGGADAALLVSARTGAGLDALLARLDRDLPLNRLEEVRLRIPHPAGRVMHLLHERGEILAEHHAERRVDLVARVPASLLPQLQAFLAR